MGGKLIDKTGQYFDRLLVIRRAPNSKSNRTRWLCRCDCDNHVVVHSSRLVKRKILSCGCNGLEYNETKYSYTKLYRIWDAIKQRCYNPNSKQFKDYGGRGITVCDEWRNNSLAFRKWALASGYREILQIDRIDNDKGYSPGNCRFVTRKEQMRNRRNSLYFGDKLFIEIAEESGIPYRTLHGRLKRNPNITLAQLVKPSIRKSQT